jgi:hypothetical protein
MQSLSYYKASQRLWPKKTYTSIGAKLAVHGYIRKDNKKAEAEVPCGDCEHAACYFFSRITPGVPLLAPVRELMS